MSKKDIIEIKKVNGKETEFCIAIAKERDGGLMQLQAEGSSPAILSALPYLVADLIHQCCEREGLPDDAKELFLALTNKHSKERLKMLGEEQETDEDSDDILAALRKMLGVDK